MAFKTLIVDGDEHFFFTEKGMGDGGVVVNHVAPDFDGELVNFRHWFSDPARAQQEFDAIDEKKAREAVGFVKAIMVENAVKLEQGRDDTVVGKED